MTKDRLHSIQILRGLAALMVVWHHAIKAYTLTVPDFAFGYTPSIFAAAWFREGLGAGVDIFFVISGFIMVYGARPYSEGHRPASHFLAKRLRRIYPPYWIVTALMIALVYGQTQGHSPDLTPWRIISSLLLLPSENQHGLLQPILGVGWTLSYEMYFYGLFFISLRFARGFYFPAVAGAMIVLWLVAALLVPPGNLHIFLANPIVLEFLMGGCLALLIQRAPLPAALAFAIPLGLGAMFLGSALEQQGNLPSLLRAAFWGLPASLIVAGMLALPVNSNRRLNRTLERFGDASYSLYLIHIPVIYFFAPLLLRSLTGITILHSLDAMIALSVAASVAAGLIFYHGVERWMQAHAPGLRPA